MSNRGPTTRRLVRRQVDVADEADFISRFGRSLTDGGTFLAEEAPPPLGATVLVDFVLPDAVSLCQITCRVTHARPASAPGDKTAGALVNFTQLDAKAQTLRDRLQAAAAPVPAPATATPASGGAPRVIERLRRSDSASGALREGPVIGIDLGTTNSCVAYSYNGEPHVLTTAQGYETIPSVVFIGADKQVLAGHAAVEHMMLAPGRGIYESKRFIGRAFASKEVGMFAHFFQYGLALAKNGLAGAKVDGMVIPLEVVSGYILWQMKKIAQDRLQREVSRAVITVPAYYGETQRRSVRDAARMAGLHVERLLTEPTAAAVAYGYGRNISRTILVYDLGGGTFDASVLRISGDTMEVLATDGDPFLGGSDFDNRLTEHALSTIERTYQIDVRASPVAVQRVRQACEGAKKHLSESFVATLDIPYLVSGPKGMVSVQMQIDRTLFEGLTRDLMDRTLSIVQNTLNLAQVNSDGVDDVILAGGQSRTPRIRQLLTERFGKKTSRNVHPDHAVAIGAALVAEAIGTAQTNLRLIDVLPASLRLALANGATTVLLPRGQKLPAQTHFDVQFSDASGAPLTVSLCRGEADASAANQALGRLRFPGDIVPARGTVRVALAVSEEGLIRVTASNQEGKQHELTLALPSEQGGEHVVESDELVIAG